MEKIFRIYNFISEVERILHKTLDKAEITTAMKCLELGYSTQTTANLL